MSCPHFLVFQSTLCTEKEQCVLRPCSAFHQETAKAVSSTTLCVATGAVIFVALHSHLSFWVQAIGHSLWSHTLHVTMHVFRCAWKQLEFQTWISSSGHPEEGRWPWLWAQFISSQLLSTSRLLLLSGNISTTTATYNQERDFLLQPGIWSPIKEVRLSFVLCPDLNSCVFFQSGCWKRPKSSRNVCLLVFFLFFIPTAGVIHWSISDIELTQQEVCKLVILRWHCEHKA